MWAHRALSTLSAARGAPLFFPTRARLLSSAAPPLVGSAAAIALEDRYCARTYSPLPFVVSRAVGCLTYDPEGVSRIDFLAAFSAVNQGHCHPRILAALREQASRLTLISRAFHSDRLGPFAELLCGTMGYDRMLPANSGVEGWEVAVKLVRKWAHATRRAPPDGALVLFPDGNFGGRTLGAISASRDPASYGGYGPLLPGIRHVPFGDVAALERALDAEPNIVAFFTEPIQGEAGIQLPPPGYLAAAAAACRARGVLLVADEVQTGLGRAGALLASWGEGAPGAGAPGAARPDIVVLGKALGGGVLPVSAVLADDAIMLCIKPGEHGSTFGGNALAAAVGEAALRVVLEEGLCAAAVARGRQLREGLAALVAAHPRLLAGSRGVGLMCALEVRPDAADARGAPVSAWDVCLALGDAPRRFGTRHGLLTKPTHGNIIRLTPPLVISEALVAEALNTLGAALAALERGAQ